MLLDFVAHRQQLAARGRRPLLRRATEATRHATWRARHVPELPISRKGRGDHKGCKQKGTTDRHGLSSPLEFSAEDGNFIALFGTNDGMAAGPVRSRILWAKTAIGHSVRVYPLSGHCGHEFLRQGRDGPKAAMAFRFGFGRSPPQSQAPDRSEPV